MDMVICSIGFDQAGLKLLADAGEYVTERLMGGFRQDLPAVLSDKNQVDV